VVSLEARALERRAREERDEAVLDGFIERYKALAAECQVEIWASCDGAVHFCHGIAMRPVP
jgi:hypothetical protein